MPDAGHDLRIHWNNDISAVEKPLGERRLVIASSLLFFAGIFSAGFTLG
jgi:hypothetical protein